MKAPLPTPNPFPERVYLVLVVTVVFLIGIYTLLRFSGNGSSDIDVTVFAVTIDAMRDAATLQPDVLYINGYGYGIISLYAMTLLGVDIGAWQTIVAPLLIVWVVVPAWLLYRELLGSGRAASLAAFLLTIQPELLYVITRGTHEKFTRGVMLLALFVLLRSMRSYGNLRVFGALVVAFYLFFYAALSLNSLLATSFLMGIAMSLVLAWAVGREGRVRLSISPQTRTALTRLGFAVGVSAVLGFLFIIYVYEPAQRPLATLATAGERTAALVLDVEERSAYNPYERLQTAWVSQAIYLLVSSANWLLLVASVLIWLWMTGAWLLRGRSLGGRADVLLWSFYTAFAAQGFFSILIDFGGVFSNLQQRAFPSFSIFAAALLVRWLMGLRFKRVLWHRLTYTSVGLLVGVLALLSLLKATDEPVISNQWKFHHPAEITALNWANGFLTDRALWTGILPRAERAFVLQNNGAQIQFQADNVNPEAGTRDFFVSDLERVSAGRLQVPLPLQADDFVTYDNGYAQIFHRRPDTAYQE